MEDCESGLRMYINGEKKSSRYIRVTVQTQEENDKSQVTKLFEK